MEQPISQTDFSDICLSRGGMGVPIDWTISSVWHCSCSDTVDDKIRLMGEKIIFTDLDGSLLDEETYQTWPADSLFDLLEHLGVPVVFNSSKTLPEMLKIRRLLRNRQPFVVENGSAVYAPIDYEIAGADDLETIDGYRRYVLGTARQRLRQFLKSSASAFKYVALTEMSEQECASATGLTLSDIQLAQTREFSEPLLWNDSQESRDELAEAARSEGLRLLAGGRFVHLMGDTDKSVAQSWLVDRLRLSHQKNYKVVALGDSENDVQMLADADYPVLIRSNKHDFPHVDTKATVYRTRRVGPSGWHDAIRAIVLRERLGI